ncbi:hypothetical protein VTO42DRAFT_4399 [Malbranchea cinnamomea]
MCYRSWAFRFSFRHSFRCCDSHEHCAIIGSRVYHLFCLRPQKTMPSIRPPHRTLLLTLDAFNTVFHPRLPVAVQYTQAAQSLGFLPPTASADAVQSAFRSAFKHQSALRPNYGRQIPGFGGPKAWWGSVIRECMANVKGNGTREEDVPEELVQSLIERFNGAEGYSLYPDAGGFFERLRKWKESKRRIREDIEVRGNGKQFDWIVVGILSNSDDRVASILTSFGLRVGTAWADGGELLDITGKQIPSDGHYDVDFIVTSYEAGHEKPHKGIFEVAEKRAREHLLTTESDSHYPRFFREQTSWSYVHVGDDYEQDYQGAINAGWDCYLLPRDDIGHSPEDLTGVRKINSLSELLPQLGLEDCPE